MDFSEAVARKYGILQQGADTASAKVANDYDIGVRNANNDAQKNANDYDVGMGRNAVDREGNRLDSTVGMGRNANDAQRNANDFNIQDRKLNMESEWAKGIAKVPGKGDGTKDTVKAKLAPGEAVLNKAAADHMGRGLIHALNVMGTRKMGLTPPDTKKPSPPQKAKPRQKPKESNAPKLGMV